MATKITDHVARAQALLPGYLQESVDMLKLVEAVVTPIQTLEDSLYDLLTKRYLSTAEGVQLDNIGEILDETREVGQSDSDYLAVLYGKAFQLAKSGEIESVISAFKYLTSADYVILTEYMPAAFSITAVKPVDDITVAQAASIETAMEETSAAGVAHMFFIGVEPLFLWGAVADVDAAGLLPPSNNGFGAVSAVDAGGQLAAGDTGGNFVRVL